MANEKFTLTWPSHSSHFQDVLANLLTTEESSDVTLVCADQVKFKSHKFVLKACSPVFEGMEAIAAILECRFYQMRILNAVPSITVFTFPVYELPEVGVNLRGGRGWRT